MRVMVIRILSALVFILLTMDIYSQSVIVNREIDYSYNNSTWKSLKGYLEAQSHAMFIVYPDTLDNFKISIPVSGGKMFDVLKSNFGKAGYKLSVTTDSSVVFITGSTKIVTSLPPGFFNTKVIKQEDSDTLYNNTISEKVATSSVYVPKIVIVGESGKDYITYTLSGIVTGTADKKPIIGGTIYVSELGTGTTTNEFGFYELKLKPGKYSLRFNSLESIEKTIRVQFRSSGKLDAELDQNLFELQEVTISSSKTSNVKGSQLGFDKISSRVVKEIPLVFGEQDVLKVALLLPGVTSVGEGVSGLNVRGSPSDQNLFYFDHMPVYNTAHLFGFFSAFNADIINDFELYKGSIPARFGGRLSSVFNIKTKTGNMQKFSARGGLSPVTARLMVEGPVIKDRVSYIAGVRSTYSDWVLKLVNDPEVRNSEAYFGDLTLGLNAIINNKNSIKVSGYYSQDRVKLANSTKYRFKNQGLSLDWFHGFTDKLNLNISAYYSDYSFSEENSEIEVSAYSRDYLLNSNGFDAYMNFDVSDKHYLTGGLSSVLYNLDRGDLTPLDNKSLLTPISFGNEKGLESALFISDEWKVTPLLTLVGGLRYNLYKYLGPQTVFKYSEGLPHSASTIIDTLHFSNNQIVKSYDNLDYRLSAVYLISPDFSVKASYNRLSQYIFMLSNTIAASPADTWKLSDYNIKPLTGDQVSAGLFLNFGQNLEGSLEAYYKHANNIVEYKDGADMVTSKYIDQDVLQGELDAYGIELMIKKPFGKLTGWLNYTYSNSTVLVNNTSTGEDINFGLRYPSNFDRPHSFNLVANFMASRRLILSGNISYSTGRPITYPTSIYYIDGKKFLYYSNRNEYRIPDYFRLDLAVRLEGNLVSKKLAHGQFVFSVYNVTGRKNAYSVYFIAEDGKINGYKMSVFGTQIYSVSYEFKLGNYDD